MVTDVVVCCRSCVVVVVTVCCCSWVVIVVVGVVVIVTNYCKPTKIYLLFDKGPKVLLTIITSFC